MPKKNKGQRSETLKRKAVVAKSLTICNNKKKAKQATLSHMQDIGRRIQIRIEEQWKKARKDPLYRRALVRDNQTFNEELDGYKYLGSMDVKCEKGCGAVHSICVIRVLSKIISLSLWLINVGWLVNFVFSLTPVLMELKITKALKDTEIFEIHEKHWNIQYEKHWNTEYALTWKSLTIYTNAKALLKVSTIVITEAENKKDSCAT